MKIEFGKEADGLYADFREVYTGKSKEIEEGVVIDFDEDAHIVGIEILDVSQRVRRQHLA